MQHRSQNWYLLIYTAVNFILTLRMILPIGSFTRWKRIAVPRQLSDSAEKRKIEVMKSLQKTRRSCKREQPSTSNVRRKQLLFSTTDPDEMKDVSQSTDESLRRRIAATRIHIERLISRIREFHFLGPHARIDRQLVRLVDHCIVVAAAIQMKCDNESNL
ncbi:hypothetical protein GE061_012771 [Apolygus lucorum]|uniref:DDE Tnp4 domain-containing protein n=2 Tax=Apolygus lucorum TaxID=248454 RepID=A0A8S9XT95_APOLU|nr:hypothetical protein GE061_012771 [Apolygus lucorum]